MSLFTVDTEKCIHDGICAEECPAKIIIMKNDLPVPGVGADALCIKCGHCVAVCPTSAFSLSDMTPDDCLPVNKAFISTPEHTEHFLRYRRSIRNFKEVPVEKEILRKAIRIASHAPSGYNSQPIKWQIIYDKDDVKRISTMIIDWMLHMINEKSVLSKVLQMELVVAGWQYGMDTISRGAPHLILANSEKNNPWANEACNIAASYLELTLPSFNLGGCRNGYIRRASKNWVPLREALDLDANIITNAVLMVGHPTFEYMRMPPRNEPDIRWMNE